MAQRLLRKICDACAATYTPSKEEVQWLKHYMGDKYLKSPLRKGAGCAHCLYSGYRGRIPTFELFEVDEEIADTLSKNDLPAFMKLVRAKGYVSLTENALSLAIEGVTTVREAMRVTMGVNDVTEEFVSFETEALPAE